MEAGGNMPSIQTLLLLARVYGVPAWSILQEVENTLRPPAQRAAIDD